jgi:hypothetical protein
LIIRQPRQPLRAIPVPAGWMPRRPLFHAPAAELQPVPEGAWQPLFDGTSFKGWSVDDKKELWTVENGMIRCHGKGGGYLRTEQQYENFVLATEFNVDKGTNSGIFVRWSDIKDPVHTGIEVQVIDSAGKAKPDKHDAGALYDMVAPTSNPMKPAGEWNSMIIACNGPFVSVLLNGVKVSETDFSKYTEVGKSPDGTKNKFKYAMANLPRKGYIGLQNHGGGLWYRNLMLLPL